MSKTPKRWLVVTSVWIGLLTAGSAVAQSTTAGAMSPDERAIRQNLAYALVTDGQYRAAWTHVEALLAAGDDAAWLHLSAAQICLYWLLEYECVEREATRALELRPDNPRAHLLLGQMAQDQGEDELAIHHYRESLTRRNTQIEVSTRLASLLAESGDGEAALRVLREALRHHPREARLYLNLARLLEETDVDEAEAAYEQAVLNHDEPVVAWGHLLRFYERHGRAEAAAEVRQIVDQAVERRRFRPIR